jgi:fibronectin-binding autotransporter adhesin
MLRASRVLPILVVGVLVCGAAHAAVTIGPGDINETEHDMAGGGFVCVDLVNPATLPAGTYSASAFSYRFAGAGTIQPFVAVAGGDSYTPVALGDAVTLGGASDWTTSAFGGLDTFTLASDTAVYAGFYRSEGFPCPIGFGDNTGSSYLHYDGADAPGLGTPLSGGSAGTWARTYDFSITVEPSALTANVWTGALNTSWGTPGNWTDNSVPDGAGSAVMFSDTDAGPTVDLGSASHTVGRITFNGNVPMTVQASGTPAPGTLVLDNSGGAVVVAVTGSHAISAPVQLNGNLMVMTGAASDQLEISGPIGDNGAGMRLTAQGAGKLILSAPNTYTGGTALSGGTLQLSGTGTLGSLDAALTVNGGLLDLNGTAQGVGNLWGGGGSIVNNADGTTATLTIGNGDATGGTCNTVIADHTAGSGTVALVKTGSGTLTLTALSSYSGGTTVNAGTLQGGGGSYKSVVGTGLLTVNPGATFAAVNYSPTGDIGTTVSMRINGGTVDTGGWWVYSRSLELSGGQVLVPSSNPLAFIIDIAPSNTDDIIVNPAGTTPATATLGGLSMDSRQLTAGDRHYVQVNVVSDPAGGVGLTVPGRISDAGANGWGGSGPMSLVKTGSGTMELTGTGTYTGSTTVANGTLRLTNPGSLSTSTIALDSANASRLQLNAPASGDSWTLGKPVSGGSDNATVEKIGAGTVIFAGQSTYSGATIVTAGTLKLPPGAPSAPISGSLQVWLDATDVAGTGSNPADGDSVATWVNKIAGGAAFANPGNGTSNPTYSTSSLLGTLPPGKPALHFAASGPQMLTYSGGDLSGPITIFYVGGMTGGTNQRLMGSITSNFLLGYWGGNMDSNYWNRGNLGHGPVDTNAHLWSSWLNTDGSYSSYRVDNIGGEATIDSGTGGSGPGVIALGGGNIGYGEFSDGDISEVLIYNTALSDADRQAVEAYLQSKWFGTGGNNVLPITTPLKVAKDGTFDLNGGSQQIGSLADGADGGGVVTNSGSTNSVLTVDGPASTAFGGTLADGATNKLALVKAGDGALTLSGTNTYSGGTTVSGGTLEILAADSLPPGASLTIGAGGAVVLSGGLGAAGAGVSGSAAVAAVPEPGTTTFLGAGTLAGLALWLCRRKP